MNGAREPMVALGNELQDVEESEGGVAGNAEAEAKGVGRRVDVTIQAFCPKFAPIFAHP